MVSKPERDQGLDLPSFLEVAREHMDGLTESYGKAGDSEEAGVIVKLTIRDLSRLDNAREEVVRRSLRGMEDDDGHLARFDQAKGERLAVVDKLDRETEEVRASDVHVSNSSRIVELMNDLSTKLRSYHQYEAKELVPFLESVLDDQELEQLGQRAWSAARSGPTHAHAGKAPADERTGLGKAWTAIGDRLRDYESVFGTADDTLAATGRSGLAPEHPLAHHQRGCG